MVFVNRVLGAVPETDTLLSDIEEGQIVKIAENGTPVEFYVAKHDYESGLNGAGRTLLVRKDLHSNQVWNSGNVNVYANNDIDTWFNGTYKNLLSPQIKSLIGTTKIYYTIGNGDSTVTTMSRGIFALSLGEIGVSASVPSGFYPNVEREKLPISDLLKIANLNGAASTQWTRSPYLNWSITAWASNANGNFNNPPCSNLCGARPCFTLPSTTKVSDDMTITG